ncbi:MAG TPA: hypothetical protein VNS58_11410 [Puia sp.]|nr:hypothetical protein [Puia sp.]
METVENTTHSLPFVGKVPRKTAWETGSQKSVKVKVFKSFVALLLCFLAGVATAALLLYTFF